MAYRLTLGLAFILSALVCGTTMAEGDVGPSASAPSLLRASTCVGRARGSRPACACSPVRACRSAVPLTPVVCAWAAAALLPMDWGSWMQEYPAPLVASALVSASAMGAATALRGGEA